MAKYIGLAALLTLALGVATEGVAQSLGPEGAATMSVIQRHVAGMQERTNPADCEARYRSFRVRNAMRPSERREDRERCRQDALLGQAEHYAAGGPEAPGSKPDTQR